MRHKSGSETPPCKSLKLRQPQVSRHFYNFYHYEVGNHLQNVVSDQFILEIGLG